MNKESIIEKAIPINTIGEVKSVIDGPREGKIYLYHQGFLANDLQEKDNLNLRMMNSGIKRAFEKRKCMLFQKKIKMDKYLYLLVR